MQRVGVGYHHCCKSGRASAEPKLPPPLGMRFLRLEKYKFVDTLYTQLIFAIQLDNIVYYGLFPFIFVFFLKMPSLFIFTNPYYFYYCYMLYLTIGTQDDSRSTSWLSHKCLYFAKNNLLIIIYSSFHIVCRSIVEGKVS